ncbi:hypothetical protein BDF22DRAFT_674438 [Syncephalis plumigaleata]|nr:hypothetical protein BDF22DRAFT_674438 [Syncephalis plumigaleata]
MTAHTYGVIIATTRNMQRKSLLLMLLLVLLLLPSIYMYDSIISDEIKAISKASDDKKNGEYNCFVHDETAFFKGHAVNMQCNASERTQFFKKVPAPATLPRY